MISSLGGTWMLAERSNSGGLHSQRLQRLSTIIMPPHTAVISHISSLPSALRTLGALRMPASILPSWLTEIAKAIGYASHTFNSETAGFPPTTGEHLPRPGSRSPLLHLVSSTLPLPHIPLWLMPPLHDTLWCVPRFKNKHALTQGCPPALTQLPFFLRETSRNSTLPGFLLTS